MAHGYWEPHSSSIDFCEPNYLLTEYIAEPHNVWSSALIPLMALTGYLYSNPTHEKRFSVMYLVLGLVGVGSTALHWTLHWIPQSSDELPMLWVSLSIVYALYTTREQRGSTRSRTLGYLFALIGLLESVIYYTFQQIYIVFVLSIVVCTAAVVAWLLWLTFWEPNKSFRPIRLSLFYTAFASLVLVGTSVWVVDMNLCPLLLPHYMHTGGLTLHVVWHLGSAFGTYVTFLFAEAVRVQSLQQTPRLSYVCGFFPIVTIPGIDAKED